MNGRFGVAAAAFLTAAMLLSSCGGGGLPNFSQLGGKQESPQVHRNESERGIELVLDPVSVWDEKGAAAPQKVQLDDDIFALRHRPPGTFERAWVEAGLFWHSRVDKVFLPLVVLGDSVDIREVKISTRRRTAVLARTKKLNFKPGGGGLDGRERTAAVFSMRPEMLSSIVDEGNAKIAVTTNRGVLVVALNVADDVSERGVRYNAQYLFTRFARERERALGQ